MIQRTISIAPMMEWTDRHFRYFLRLITKHALLYTEMVHCNAIIKGERDYLLGYNNSEHPLALQLGGSNPSLLTEAVKIAESYNYDEYNLNIGCPSERVQAGSFGACLMAEPELVSDCVAAMQKVTDKPVTVKTRIGIDKQDDYEFLVNFIEKVKQAGCDTFIIHARSAWLQGLSPKENRQIPPLKYHFVYQLKQDYPELNISINGGITDLQQAEKHLQQVDGVMFGRLAYQQPYQLAQVDKLFYADNHEVASRQELIEQYLPYMSQQLQKGIKLSAMTRHLNGIFHGQPGGKKWREYLSNNANNHNANIDIVQQALQFTCE